MSIKKKIVRVYIFSKLNINWCQQSTEDLSPKLSSPPNRIVFCKYIFDERSTYSCTRNICSLKTLRYVGSGNLLLIFQKHCKIFLRILINKLLCVVFFHFWCFNFNWVFFVPTWFCVVLDLELESQEVASHSSQFEGLCSTKSSSKMLQNLPYFWHKKTHIVLFIFHFVLLYFFSNECPDLCMST